MATDSASMQPYVYTPLASGEIRLLTPVAADGNESISWTLQTVSLVDQPDFDALSYTWGSQDETFPVSCNERRLLVHHNLFTALPYVARRRDGVHLTMQPIWIDAVCINQVDEDEKMIQIDLMGQIYTRARRVWAWLGIADSSHVEHILSRLPAITKHNRRLVRRGGYLAPMMLDKPWEVHQIPSNHLPALKCLFRNPWFSRLWIIQEATLAKSVTFLCGEHKIGFRLLCQALEVDLVFESTWLDPEGGHLFQQIDLCELEVADYSLNRGKIFKLREHIQTRKRVSDSSLSSLKTILPMLEGFKCSAPQDRILGMLGMLKETDASDYQAEKGCKIPELYTHFSRFILARSPLDATWWLYVSHAFAHHRQAGLPSWVPDLHHLSVVYAPPIKSVTMVNSEGMSRFRASALPASLKLGICNDEIELRGKAIDQIALAFPSLPVGLQRPERGHRKELLNEICNMAKWESSIARTVLPDSVARNTMATTNHYVTEDTYVQTLLLDDLSFEARQISQDDWNKKFKRFRAFANILRKILGLERTVTVDNPEDDTNLANLVSEEDMDMFKSFHQRDGQIVTHRLFQLRDTSFFTTLQGRFGFTSEYTRPDDLLCVFNGAPYPHVIRRVEDRNGEERYKLIGPAFVLELMYGAADSMDIGEKKFVIV